MIKVTLEDGFKCEIEEEALDDMELIRLLGKVDAQPWLIDDVLIKVIGEDGLNRLNEHLRTKDGRIPSKAYRDAVSEIITKGGESLKKS